MYRDSSCSRSVSSLSGPSSLSSMSTLFHSFASGTPRRALFFLLPNDFSGSCRAPKTNASISAQDTVMRVSPLIFLGFPLAIFGCGSSADAVGSCDRSGEGFLPSSNAMKASEMRRSTLLGAWLGLLWRHRSEQYFTGVEAALVVCDFRVPLNGCCKLVFYKGWGLVLWERKPRRRKNDLLRNLKWMQENREYVF